MTWRKKILIGFFAIAIGIQFIQPTRNNNNEKLSTDLINVMPVPGNVQAILQNACYDCHCNKTNYPWYSRIQPLAWWLSDHIQKGKAELNFSDFGSYPKRRQMSKLNELINSVNHGKMPLRSYRILHKNARLSTQQKEMLITWAENIKGSLEADK